MFGQVTKIWWDFETVISSAIKNVITDKDNEFVWFLFIEWEKEKERRQITFLRTSFTNPVKLTS